METGSEDNKFFPLTRSAARDILECLRTFDLKLIAWTFAQSLLAVPLAVWGDVFNRGKPVDLFPDK